MSEIAWAAGLYDGEGSTFCTYKGRFRRDGKRYQQLRCEVSQTYNPEVLHRFAAAIGFGNVCGPYKKHGNVINYKWVVSGKHAMNAIDLLFPHLSTPKREQAIKALADKDYFDRQHNLKPGPKPKATSG